MKKITLKISLLLLFVLSFVYIPVYATDIEPPAEEAIAQGEADTAASLDVPDGLEMANPYVHVSSYEIVDGAAEPGEAFTLRVHVTNANPAADAYNVMMSFFFSGDVGFELVANETNQYYIAFLEAGETHPIDLNLRAIDTTALTTQTTTLPTTNVEFNFEYLNFEGVGFLNQTAIMLHQTEISELRLQSADVPSGAGLGQETPVQLNFANTGKTQLENIVITIEGSFIGSPLTLPYNTLNTNETLAVEETISFDTLGANEIQISASYENDLGNTYTLEPQSYTLQVAEQTVQPAQSTAQNLSAEHNEADLFSANSFWFYIIIISSALVLLIIIALVVHLMRSRKKRE